MTKTFLQLLDEEKQKLEDNSSDNFPQQVNELADVILSIDENNLEEGILGNIKERVTSILSSLNFAKINVIAFRKGQERVFLERMDGNAYFYLMDVKTEEIKEQREISQAEFKDYMKRYDNDESWTRVQSIREFRKTAKKMLEFAKKYPRTSKTAPVILVLGVMFLSGILGTVALVSMGIKVGMTGGGFVLEKYKEPDEISPEDDTEIDPADAMEIDPDGRLGDIWGN